MPDKEVTAQELAKHSTKEDCWITIHGNVYDITSFIEDHPGGEKILLKYAGKDATEEFDEIHSPDIPTKYLDESQQLGPLKTEPTSAPSAESISGVVEQKLLGRELTAVEMRRRLKMEERPALGEVLSLHDFEGIAREVMEPRGWAYYSSGADDEVTMRENHMAYGRVFFRPRILRDVTEVDYSTTILGQKSSMPIYITATALGKLGHPEGEKNLTRAGGKHGVIQMIPTLASCSFDEIVDAAIPGQVQFMQLYVNKDREKTKKIVQHAESRGIKGLFITVDAPQLGRREKDMRQKFDNSEGASVQRSDSVEQNQGAARAISSFIDPGLSWKDMAFFREITKMPLILKGVQTWEDAVMAAEAGLDGVVLSNHGGRQLDSSRSGLEVLVEVVRELKKRKLFPNPKFEIMIDGGIRRASDVLKAVALGATSVGIGRPLLYAYSAYGQEGVEHAFQLLKDEFEMNMRLLGARSIEEVVPEMVDASALTQHNSSPRDEKFASTYERLQPSTLRAKL
ncbi:cytochrome b2 [Phaffia rhodozyma]|uniref:L-lactate dehydrogenase (cytochrome) n=1 Tax=Phaffia rhodozyma TaxID=264483 RepID=A0A0F7SHZ6_PHARH|nr:cytochrome b2 [Phaffia rhodozyma]